MIVKTVSGGELDIRKCETHGHNYDARWGCSACPTKEALLIAKLKQEVADWKDAWYKQRDATGKMYWDGVRYGWTSAVKSIPWESPCGIVKLELNIKKES